MRSVVIIPARYASMRYPGKPLVNLLGKPMVLWVAERSSQAVGIENVYVATEDARIAKVVELAGFQYVMTSKEALTGTDRLAEAATHVAADIYINVQGDEPLINPNDILNICNIKKQHLNDIVNGFCWISKDENPKNINIPKVITNESNVMVYMSRCPLPSFKEQKNKPSRYKKQVCIYAFTKDDLNAFKKFGRKSQLETSEDIEILRFLELGKKVLMVETEGGTLAVDSPEDIKSVEIALTRLQK